MIKRLKLTTVVTVQVMKTQLTSSITLNPCLDISLFSKNLSNRRLMSSVFTRLTTWMSQEVSKWLVSRL